MIDRRVQMLDGPASQQPITTVSALRDAAQLVLLGEPGIGKTTVLETEAVAAGTNEIKVRELINETLVPPARTLFLDALDEYRMSNATRPTPEHTGPTTLPPVGGRGAEAGETRLREAATHLDHTGGHALRITSLAEL